MKVVVIFLLIGAAAAIAVEKQEISERITGASDAFAGQWPFMASVHHAGTFICGGALFSVQWVITSAECVYIYTGELPLQVYIAVGGITHTGLEPGKVEWPLDQIVIHPEYHSKDSFFYNNIALLHCITPVPIGNQIQPIQLPFGTEIITPPMEVLFAGWGGSSDSYPVAKLQFVTNSVVMDTGKCTSVIGLLLGKTELCTEPNAKTTACKFDHGSPLYRFDPVYGTILLGINTYAPCAATFTPTIFTNIPAYVDWIKTITG